jgi:hypothetical protein
MAKFVVGACEVRHVENRPSEVAALLNSKKNKGVTKQDVAELFFDHDANQLCFSGHTFDSAAVEALADCIGRSLSLTALSFKSLRSTSEFNAANVCCEALVNNLSVQHVDLSDCGLTAEDAAALAERLLPWNITIIDWDFSENPSMGDAGVQTIVEALLATTASVQRLNFRSCGVKNPGKIAKLLESFTCLYQVDLNANAGPALTAQQATDLQIVLMNNAALLRPHEQRTLVPLVEGSKGSDSPIKEKEEQQATPAAEKKEGADPSQPASPTGSPQRTRSGSRIRGNSFRQAPGAQPQPVPARQRANSTKAPASAAPKADDKPSEHPPLKEKHQEPQPNQPHTQQTPPQQRTENGQQKQQHPPPEKTAPAPAPAPKRPTSPARSQSQQSTQRGRSPSRTAHSPGHTAPVQRDINDGVEEWKKVRNQYNQYIRAGSPSRASTASPSRAIAKPKFVLGKRVDDHPIPSAAFKTSYARTRERAPTPAEIRKFAPWNAANATDKTAVGQVTRVEVAAETKAPTVVTFVDGGRQTYIEDDPRDIGYVARKIQTGQVKPDGALFRSNTARDMRFGVSPRDAGFVHRDAQAPGPGFYTPENEWEKRARQLRERARAVSGTGRPMFGMSAAPRPQAKIVKDLDHPGPGEYEIP